MKPHRYQVYLETDLGQRLGHIDFHALSIVRSVEAWDVLSLRCARGQSILDGLTLETLIDKRLGVYRAGFAVPALRRENIFFIRHPHYIEHGNTLEFLAVSAEEFLDRKIVAYAAGSAQAAQSDQADDMIKEVVRDNLGTDATAARQLAGLTVAPNLGRGPALDKKFSRRNVFETISEIREYSRSQSNEQLFRMVPSGVGWTFETYAGQIGSDRRFPSSPNAVIVSEEFGNFELEGEGYDATEERNVVYVGGQGEEAARTVVEVSDSVRLKTSAYNRREYFQDQTNILDDSAGALTDAGNQALTQYQARRNFSGLIQETPNFRYGIEWDFGDLLTISHRGEAYDVMARKVGIEVVPGRERIMAQVEAL